MTQKRKTEKELVEFFEVGSRNSVKNVESRDGNTWKEIKLALLLEGPSSEMKKQKFFLFAVFLHIHNYFE
jgi:hypothetical protein